MISEIDIRDWEKVDVKAARISLVNIDDAIDRVGGVYQHHSLKTIADFINAVELIQKKQVKQVAALFQKKRPCPDFGRCNCIKDCQIG